MVLSKVWVYAETDQDKVTGATLELLTAARGLGETVEAVYAGDQPGDAVAAAVGEYGATRLFTVDAGESLPGQVVGAALAGLVAEHSPDVILVAHDYDGRDALAVASARLDRPAVTNVVTLTEDGGALVAGNAVFGGMVLVDTKLTGERPWLVAVRPKSFNPEPSGGGAAEVSAVGAVDAGRIGDSKVLDRFVEEQEGPKLEEAPVVVSGGRGLGGEEHYKPLVEELAKRLKGAFGASRAIVDAGWVPYALQVGQTGKTVKPKVYIALGISGATQHLVGMKSSDNIIAVNKDAEAPIFGVADLGIVGDVHKVVPALLAALEARG